VEESLSTGHVKRYVAIDEVSEVGITFAIKDQIVYVDFY
jgi:hypothetical protein